MFDQSPSDFDSLQQQYLLFSQLSAMPDEKQRTEFLQSIGHRNQQLRTQLEQLLQAHLDPVCELLEKADRQSNWKCHPGLVPGDRVAEYQITELIGAGGMGQVYRAEQQIGIRRNVALKLIHGNAFSERSVARFEAEREALSRLDHPGIARILGAGKTQSGQQYLAMELIQGNSIVDYCNQERFDLHRRLLLFEQTCRAVHHAHQKGIIHRDLKPSNVLVTVKDGKPIVKVIDFGIAKGLDRPLNDQSMFTRIGELIGTPNYMSPEQIENGTGDLDIRSDIYSLGVLLHELVAGRLPFEFQANQGLLRQMEMIRDCEVTRPSMLLEQLSQSDGDLAKEIAFNRNISLTALLKYVKGDLDWIILKALSKAREERYESASAFGNDVVRLLNREPVEAVAHSLTYQLEKLVQNHWKACLLISGGVLAMLTLAILSLITAVKSAQTARALKNKTISLESEIQKSRQLESRAVQAEREANERARERLNEAAIAKGCSSFILDAAANSEKFELPLIALSQWQQENSDNAPKAALVELSQKKNADGRHSVENISTIRAGDLLTEATDQRQIFVGKDSETTEQNQNVVEVLEKAMSQKGIQVSPNNLDWSATLPTVSPNAIKREQIRIWESVKNEQTQRFGSHDDYVGRSLLAIGQLHAELDEPVKAQLALLKAMNALSDPSELEKCQRLYDSLQLLETTNY